jgi:GNAT superfamily N-acetyltransferase
MASDSSVGDLAAAFRATSPRTAATPAYVIALATLEHLDALPQIELEAAALLRGHAPASVLEETTPLHEFALAQREGRLWVALDGATPVGFAHVVMLTDGHPHLEELDVAPNHGRRGLGTALLCEVLAWVASVGHEELTLTTFRDVPWNMPFYARHGFVETVIDNLRPELDAIVRNEANRGLDRGRRVVMSHRVASSNPAR